MKLSCFVLGLFVFTLVSCGGGGGGGSDGGSSSSESSQGLNIPTSNLTINGLVTEGLANADVIVTIRNLTFRAKTNSSGHYSVTLAIDESHLSDLVLITAQGSEAQSKVKLASLLQSVKTLVSQAGDDRVLDVTENFGVNVTSVSTAEYALATSGAGYGVRQIIPVSEMELTNKLGWVDIKSKFELAAIIKLVAESRFNLPVGITSTLELAFSRDLTQVLKEIVNLEDAKFLDETIAAIKADKNIVVNNNESVVGSYVLDSGSRSTRGIITFNVDLAGELAVAASGQKIGFTWVQTIDHININFDEPLPDISYGTIDKQIIKTASFSIAYSSAISKSVYWQEDITVINTDGSEYGLAPHWAFSSLTDLSKTIKPEQNKLSGLWLSSGFNNSIRFNDDGSVSYGRLGEEPKIYSWSIKANKLIISDSGVEIENFYLTSDLGVGYTYVAISGVTIDEGLLIKPQENLVLKKSDMVGFWTNADLTIDALYSDDTVIKNLGSWTHPWSFIDEENAWEENSYDQDSMTYGPACNLSSKSPCTKSWSRSHKVVARMNNLHYILNKSVRYDQNENGIYTDYSLTQSRKLPEIQFFSYWIMDSSRKRFYQKTLNEIKVWDFYGNRFVVGNKSLDWPSYDEGNSFVIFNGKLQYTRDNVKFELELLSMSETGMTVCEYNEGSICVKGTEFFLGNRIPVKISLSVVGSGSIQNMNSDPFDRFDIFGNVANYSIVPDTGYKVQTVTGCGGALSGYSYITSEIRENCTITATFVKN